MTVYSEQQVDWQAKLLGLRDRAVIHMSEEIVGEDMHDNIWATRCQAHCRLCHKEIFSETSRVRWRLYQRAGIAIVGHDFVCDAQQLMLDV